MRINGFFDNSFLAVQNKKALICLTIFDIIIHIIHITGLLIKTDKFCFLILLYSRIKLFSTEGRTDKGTYRSIPRSLKNCYSVGKNLIRQKKRLGGGNIMLLFIILQWWNKNTTFELYSEKNEYAHYVYGIDGVLADFRVYLLLIHF